MTISPSSSLGAAGLAIGRVLLAALFILEGWSKLRGYEAAAAYMERYGVPGLLLPAAIVLELGGGLLIAIGWQTRIAAFALAVFCIAAAAIFHSQLFDRSHLLHFREGPRPGRRAAGAGRGRVGAMVG